MNESELLKIEARANAATPGPWEVHDVDDWMCMCATYITGPNGPDTDLFFRAGEPEAPHDQIVAVTLLQTPRVCDHKQSDENSSFIAHSRHDIPALISALRQAWKERDEAREVVIDADSMYNRPQKRQSYHVASATLRCLAQAGYKRIEEAENCRQTIKDSAAVLGCDPSHLVAMCREVMDDKRKLERENQTLSDVITGCGFELYQDRGQTGLKLLDDGTIYMPKNTTDRVYDIFVPDIAHPDAKVYGVYIKVLPGYNINQAVQLVKFPLAIFMPCGCSTSIDSIRDFPSQSVPCLCGNPNHWFVFVEAE